jgi:hypothetical protein
VDREVHWRNDKRQARLLKDAKLKYSQASIEDLNTRSVGGRREDPDIVSRGCGVELTWPLVTAPTNRIR